MCQLSGYSKQEVLGIQEEHGEFKTIYTSSGQFEARDEDAEDIIGKIQLEFVDWQKRRKASVILDEVRERTADLAGIVVEPRHVACRAAGNLQLQGARRQLHLIFERRRCL